MRTASSVRLLVVEDDPLVARALGRMFTAFGHDVTLADTCRDACQIQGSFDCAIFDVDLPDGSGLDLAERFLDEGKILVVLFFSGTRDAEVMKRAGKFGPFIHKSRGVQALRPYVSRAVTGALEAIAAGGEHVVHPGRRSQSGTRRKLPR